MKKTILFSIFILSLGSSMYLQAVKVEAHGYVSSPVSRGYQGQLDKNKFAYATAHAKYGNVINDPQSLEAKKGFPISGPADGHLASADGVVGDFMLDQTGINRWTKQPMQTGWNTFTWTYTANHRTAKWHYYMTKNGWNPEKPLSRDSLELIGEVQHDGSSSANNKSHKIEIPADRSGYHVIYAVWDVSDTANAFYNAIDVVVDPGSNSGNGSGSGSNSGNGSGSGSNSGNGSGSGSGSNSGNGSESNPGSGVSKPTRPIELHSMGTGTSSVDLMWAEATHPSGIDHYDVYRDGKKISTSSTTQYTDTGLIPNTSYTYTVSAVSMSNHLSDASEPLTITTKKDSTEPPVGSTKQWKLGSFSVPTDYTAGEKVEYNGKLYLVRQTHKNYGDPNWAPDRALSLFILE